MPPSTATTTPAKHRRVLNCDPSQDQDQDWSLATAAAAGVGGAAKPPPTMDLRADWWTVADQGATGSCVGWASADAVLRWHFVQQGRLDPSAPLSVRFQWMASKEVDPFRRPSSFIESAGTSLKAALDVARKWGALPAADLPFEPGALFAGSEEQLYARASRYRISSYFNLHDDLRGWRRWLAENGPILVRLDVDATFDSAGDTDGVLSTYRPATARGGHAVAIVGYTARRFIIRNSWGTGWGDEGFAYATNAYARRAFTEAYGVVL